MAALYRRGKIYWARAQRQNREFRRSLKTGSRAIAEKRLGQWLGELDAIAWGDKPRRLFDDAARKFTREHLPTIKPSSATRYGVSLGRLSLHFAGKYLHQITSAELADFEARRRTDVKRRGKGHVAAGPISASTIRRDLACLSAVFASCIEWEWCDTNPVPAYLKRRAKRGALREAAPRTRYLTLEEEDRLLASATPANMRTKDGRQAGKWTFAREAITLAIDTGLRRNELFSLKWSQVDVDRGLIFTTTKTKSGRLRTVPLPERSRTILGTLPREMDAPYIFVNPETGDRFRQMDKGLKAAARRGQVVDLRWHDLRRTSGCRWLQRDRKSMEEVSILLGHSSVKVTESCYAFLEGETIAASLSGRTKTGTGTTDRNAKDAHDQKVA